MSVRLKEKRVIVFDVALTFMIYLFNVNSFEVMTEDIFIEQSFKFVYDRDEDAYRKYFPLKAHIDFFFPMLYS